MAEGYLKAFLNGEAEVHSAGVENHAINENAIKIMRSDGVDTVSYTHLRAHET